MGSWDKAQVCWKHLPYSSDGAMVAHQVHTLETRFESYVCTHVCSRGSQKRDLARTSRKAHSCRAGAIEARPHSFLRQIEHWAVMRSKSKRMASHASLLRQVCAQYKPPFYPRRAGAHSEFIPLRCLVRHQVLVPKHRVGGVSNDPSPPVRR